MTVHRLGARTIVSAVLHDDRFVPHHTDDTSVGSTLSLRAAMARFSAPDAHADRRSAVESVISDLDGERAQRLASRFATAAVGEGHSADDVARTAPTLAIAELLDLGAPGEQVLADIRTVVSVIGRGSPATAVADSATDRLMALAADHPAGAVAVISALYQNVDATTAAVLAAITARREGVAPEPAVATTRRVATMSAVVDGEVFAPGDELVLEIGSAGFPFGAGRHECPGRDVAERIVDGIVAGIVAADPC